jgi:hypothetical protein
MGAIGDVFVGFDGQFVFPEFGRGFLLVSRRIDGEEGREEQRCEEEVRPPWAVGTGEAGGVGVREGDHALV